MSSSADVTMAQECTGVKYAGHRWSSSLAETHQTTVLNAFADVFHSRPMGQSHIGRDVLTAALLVAKRFGFETAPFTAMGKSLRVFLGTS